MQFEHILGYTMEGTSSAVSYRNPREATIGLRNRLCEVKRTNLLPLFEDGTEHTVSKSDKLKIYLRIKPIKKDATQMLAPPEASETSILCVCVCVCACVRAFMGLWCIFKYIYFQICLFSASVRSVLCCIW
jgi:hypothetical protein